MDISQLIEHIASDFMDGETRYSCICAIGPEDGKTRSFACVTFRGDETEKLYCSPSLPADFWPGFVKRARQLVERSTPIRF